VGGTGRTAFVVARSLLIFGVLAFVGSAVVVVAALLFILPFGEPALDEESPAVLLVRAPTADRLRELELRLGPADVEALGLDSATVDNDFGTFRLQTAHMETEDLPYEHCLVDELVVTSETGGVEHVVPAGTCLSTDEALELG